MTKTQAYLLETGSIGLSHFLMQLLLIYKNIRIYNVIKKYHIRYLLGFDQIKRKVLQKLPLLVIKTIVHNSNFCLLPKQYSISNKTNSARFIFNFYKKNYYFGKKEIVEVLLDLLLYCSPN